MRPAPITLLASIALTFSMGAAFAATLQTATLAVEKMTCGTCPIVVKKALNKVPGVSSTSVDLDKRTATVTFDPDKTNVGRLTQATADAGFPSKLIATP
jgi:periplasmic mercuric ion binding protein